MGESAWERLAQVYAERPIALVLGAGVPQASGIPTWHELLCAIAERIGVDPAYVQAMQEQGHSLPAIASAFEHVCGGRERLVELLRAALYPARLDERTPNPTLRAVAALCTVRGAAGFAPNPAVAAVATTNVDCLLQDFVTRRYGAPLLRAVERASAEARGPATPIYPLHGVLRPDRREQDASDRIVITEQDFFDVFDAPTSYANYTMLHLLREHPCCFVGQSMIDENIRRLLHYSRKERAEALTHERLDPSARDEALLRHFAVMRRPLAPAAAALARLGVRVLEIEEHDEIAERFRALYELRPDARWDDVFP
jgi:hypothetical protein